MSSTISPIGTWSGVTWAAATAQTHVMTRQMKKRRMREVRMNEISVFFTELAGADSVHSEPSRLYGYAAIRAAHPPESAQNRDNIRYPSLRLRRVGGGSRKAVRPDSCGWVVGGR